MEVVIQGVKCFVHKCQLKNVNLSIWLHIFLSQIISLLVFKLFVSVTEMVESTDSALGNKRSYHINKGIPAAGQKRKPG